MDQLCTYCQKAIHLKQPRVQCYDCPSSRSVVLCLECFSCGVEAGNHRSSHDYQIYTESSLQIFPSRFNWTQHEIENLLEAVETLSFGKWSDIASEVGSKSAKECLDFYTLFFINGNIGRASFHKHTTSLRSKDHTGEQNATTSSSSSATTSSSSSSLVDMPVQDQQELGYMALRDDFDHEYDNTAENDLVSMEMGADDDDVDIAFKLFKVSSYRCRLTEREKRKKISKEHEIMVAATSAGTKKMIAARKKLVKEERDLKDRMRLFARMHKHTDHENLTHNLIKLQRLKVKVRDAQNYRRNGLTKIIG
ncbi:hypothetical protein HELRODRAFT_194579 [Helobdella robusta]|uniref:Uncharacterized protein n=1 Tax=Helobdella robusta TaxID=6412 RepID=T1FW77_HELRO|nr:hypothetical protein HELRODRAFT_194579 [Helobdella robusta]ESN91028.1 hypothetical protein HELRODRAFT_194579 [Helobdella robusta]